MKARVFIGSSTEALDVAYAIQENLDYDANITVWTQGIFELSNSTLDDLIKAIKNSDFGIFVFKPDDIVQIRNEKSNAVRDNVIFELGLFIGKLGKERVYFVIPDNVSNFHLPTDLLGVTPGRYNAKREDNNLKAALGPFCNQVRQKFKSFTYENLIDLAEESNDIKRIAIEKPAYWEFLLTAEILESRLIEINLRYKELEKDLVFRRSKIYKLTDYIDWVTVTANDMVKLVSILKNIIEAEFVEAYGKPGVPGNVFEIKSACERVITLCKELLSWEYELLGINPPEEMVECNELLKGWTKIIIHTINHLPIEIKRAVNAAKVNGSNQILVNLEIPTIPNLNKVHEIISKAVYK